MAEWYRPAVINRTGSRRARHPQLACITALVLLLASGLSGCGDDGEGQSQAPIVVDGEPIRFQPAASAVTAFGDIPWPSDLYRTASGVRADIPGLEKIAAMPGRLSIGLGALDAFGRSTGALFFLDAAVDPQSLPHDWQAANRADASAFLIDIDPTSATRGRRYPAYAKYLPSLGCVSLIPVPGIVLPPGVRHAAVVTIGARATNGRPLTADDDLQRIAALAPGARSTDAERLYGAALDQLVATHAVAGRHEVAGLAVFTTSRRAFEMPELRDRLHQQPQPQLILDAAAAAPYSVAVFGSASHPSLDEWLGTPTKDENGFEWPGGDNPGGIAHDQIGVIASGAFVAPSFLDRNSKHFERNPGDGAYVLADANARIPVTLVIPKAPPPANGYPVVIHGHGLSNHRGSMLGVANELARAGFAMIGIDDVLHGSRQGLRDVRNNYAGTYQGPDGIPDSVGLPILFFGGFSDFLAMRDNFRQTVLDQTSLVRLIQSPQLDLSSLAAATGGTTPKLDPQRIFWSGGSLGGIMGAMTIAVEPEIRAAALQVPGAGFIQFITTSSAELAPLVSTLASAALGLQGSEPLDEFHPAALLLGAITEAGDPLAYAPHVLRDPLLAQRTPPDVLVTYAVDDEVLPNIATHALVRALGLGLAAPNLFEIPGVPTVTAPVAGNLASHHTGAAVQYLPANHGLGYARYDTRQFYPDLPSSGPERFPRLPRKFTFEQPVREHLAQLVTFFESVAQGEPGRIEVTSPPRVDYDNDGVSDADELAAGTDPYAPESH